MKLTKITFKQLEANGDSFEHTVQTAYTETVPGSRGR